MNPQLYLFLLSKVHWLHNKPLVTVILIEIILDSCCVTNSVLWLYYILHILFCGDVWDSGSAEDNN